MKTWEKGKGRGKRKRRKRIDGKQTIHSKTEKKRGANPKLATNAGKAREEREEQMPSSKPVHENKEKPREREGKREKQSDRQQINVSSYVDECGMAVALRPRRVE